MSLLNQILTDSEWISLRVYRGSAGMSDPEEFQRLITAGYLSIARIKGESVVIISNQAQQTLTLVRTVDKYPKDVQQLIQQAFSRFARSRQSGRIANSVLQRVLKDWSEFTVDAVERGLEIYLAKQGSFDERYCTGIIRRIAGEAKPPSPPQFPSTPQAVANEIALNAKITEKFERVLRNKPSLSNWEAQQLLDDIRQELTQETS